MGGKPDRPFIPNMGLSASGLGLSQGASVSEDEGLTLSRYYSAPWEFFTQLPRYVRLHDPTTSSNSEGHMHQFWPKAVPFKTCRITR